MSVDDIRAATRGLLVCGARNFEVTGVSTDSRTIKPGELFVALSGDKFDGHDYIRQVLEAGACGAVYSRDFPVYKDDSSRILLKVTDTLQALGDMAKAYRKTLKATVVAVTGSNGKTTTKEMTRHIVEEKFPTVASPSSFNNFIGLPLTLFKAESATRVIVLEMGTNHPGEIARLAEIAAPDVGVITNVGRTHLEGLKSLEGVAAAKAELLHALENDGVAILNADDPSLMKMRSWITSKIFTFGIDNPADVFARAIERTDGGFAFSINSAERCRLNVPGFHNIYNALAAIAVARRLGLDLAYAAGRLSAFRLPSMRLEEKTIRGATVINDAYNANPESMSRAIDELKGRKGKRRIFVFADMLELGPESDALHRELGVKAASAGFDAYWATGTQARLALDAAVGSGVPSARAKHFPDVDTLGAALSRELSKGDVVLVKGSRGMGLEKVFNHLK
jgi:UDP-N-acetylmuramoyl-tripeptide--D-alanyl-D-alanine ligase